MNIGYPKIDQWIAIIRVLVMDIRNLLLDTQK